MHAAEPNEDFSSATILAAGLTSISDSVDSAVFADTIMGAFDEADLIIAQDDDGSNLGDGLASALFGLAVNADGSIRLKVTGFDDGDFDGIDDEELEPHLESGDYGLFVTVRDSGGTEIDAFSTQDFLDEGLVDNFMFSDPSYVGGFFDAEIDNIIAGGSDVDFWRFNGLPANATFVAEITAGGVDTILGHFDDQGAPITIDDDGGTGDLSKLSGSTDGSGEVVLAVTGFDDNDFEGFHAQFGSYTLDINLLLKGDANNDLLVTGLDLITVQQNFGTIGSDDGFLIGDANDDGLVTGLDLITVQENFGAALAAPAAAPVPEPTMIWLFGLSAALLSMRR